MSAPERRRPGDLLAAAALCLLFALAASRTWLRWGDLVVDCGRDWAWALELASGGKRLYRDLSYHHGPLAPYANALLFRSFGARLDVLAVAGLGLAAAATALLYALCRRGIGSGGAFLACAAFLFDCAFAHLSSYGGYNFVLPYSWAATYGLVAALGSLEAALRWRGGGRDGWLVLALAGLALAGAAKLEIFAALLLTHVWMLRALDDVRRRRALAGGAAVAAALVGVYAFFASSAGAAELVRRNLLIPHNLWGSSQLHDAGILAWRAGLAQAAISFAATAAAVGLALWSARGSSRSVGATARAAAAAGASAALGGWLGPRLQFKALPFFLAAWLLWRRRAGAPASFEPVLLLGGLLLPRIALNAGAQHYGFYLLAAGLAGYHYALWEWVPATFLRAPSRRWAYAASIGAFLAGGVLSHMEVSARNFRRRGVLASGPRGSLRVGGAAGRAQEETIRFLAPRAGDAIVAIPEGAGIGFLAGLRHSVALDTFLPRDIGDPEREARAIRMIDEARPEFVLILPRDTSEFGVGPFGKGYGLGLAEYLRTHYALERMVEARSPGDPSYRVAILRRLTAQVPGT